jgi:hypothetical protein
MWFQYCIWESRVGDSVERILKKRWINKKQPYGQEKGKTSLRFALLFILYYCLTYLPPRLSFIAFASALQSEILCCQLGMLRVYGAVYVTYLHFTTQFSFPPTPPVRFLFFFFLIPIYFAVCSNTFSRMLWWGSITMSWGETLSRASPLIVGARPDRARGCE